MRSLPFPTRSPSNESGFVCSQRAPPKFRHSRADQVGGRGLSFTRCCFSNFSVCMNHPGLQSSADSDAVGLGRGAESSFLTAPGAPGAAGSQTTHGTERV